MRTTGWLLAACLLLIAGCVKQSAQVVVPEGPMLLSDIFGEEAAGAGSSRDGSDGHLTVPPGYEMHVYFRGVEPSFSRSDSGFLIAQLGTDGTDLSVLAALEKLAQKGKNEDVILIIPPEFLSTLADPDQFMSEFSSIYASSRDFVSYNVVLPYVSPVQEEFARQFQAAGMGVFHSANDGACFLEVHRPDGSIVIGMPGEKFEE